MNTTWVVQSNIAGSDTRFLLEEACNRLELDFYPLSIKKGQTLLPDELPDGNLVVHGATTLVLLASKDSRFREGVFFNEATFCHEGYKGFGEYYINTTAELMTWENMEDSVNENGSRFIKPPDDLKAFTGFVATNSSFETLKKGIGEALDGGVLVCEPIEVMAEWRLFVVNKRLYQALCIDHMAIHMSQKKSGILPMRRSLNGLQPLSL